ncbi:unnamed protein product [Paramecium sonneborni]|uniref:Uncharacterized protein n=1 Tax=Paramecium sonneborni TaxID=65129 RepID=A0A8S1RMV1_9CILI|nr:unnamed protein product [Paramecium sonneborni]
MDAVIQSKSITLQKGSDISLVQFFQVMWKMDQQYFKQELMYQHLISNTLIARKLYVVLRNMLCRNQNYQFNFSKFEQKQNVIQQVKVRSWVGLIKEYINIENKQYYLCDRFFGPEFNLCFQYLYETLLNGAYNQCPSNNVLLPEYGCRPACDILYQFYFHHQCQYFPSLVIAAAEYFYLTKKVQRCKFLRFRITQQRVLRDKENC